MNSQLDNTNLKGNFVLNKWFQKYTKINLTHNWYDESMNTNLISLNKLSKLNKKYILFSIMKVLIKKQLSIQKQQNIKYMKSMNRTIYKQP